MLQYGSLYGDRGNIGLTKTTVVFNEVQHDVSLHLLSLFLPLISIHVFFSHLHCSHLAVLIQRDLQLGVSLHLSPQPLQQKHWTMCCSNHVA